MINYYVSISTLVVSRALLPVLIHGVHEVCTKHPLQKKGTGCMPLPLTITVSPSERINDQQVRPHCTVWAERHDSYQTGCAPLHCVSVAPHMADSIGDDRNESELQPAEAEEDRSAAQRPGFELPLVANADLDTTKLRADLEPRTPSVVAATPSANGYHIAFAREHLLCLSEAHSAETSPLVR